MEYRVGSKIRLMDLVYYNFDTDKYACEKPGSCHMFSKYQRITEKVLLNNRILYYLEGCVNQTAKMKCRVRV